MKRRWETDELIEHWTLLPAELVLLGNKSGATRLGFGLLLKAFQLEARFPQRKQDLPGTVVVFVAKQVGVDPEAFLHYQWQGRTIAYHRAQIRAALGLPATLFAGVPPKVLRAYYQRALVEEPYELRRHPRPVRLTLLAVFCWLRSRELTDTLVDLLLQIIHRLGAKAERKVERELLEDLKRVSGKANLLFQLAETALDRPEGVIRDVLYPVVGEQTLRDLVAEYTASGPRFRHRVQTRMRTTYRAYYRRAIPPLLRTLEFHSNNVAHRPVMRALALLARYDGRRQRLFGSDEEIPLDGVVRKAWRDLVIEQDAAGRERVQRLTYELCVLQVLGERLRCKEVWVQGANRYRDPDDDLPADFAERRDDYYAALQLPSEADTFIGALRQELTEGLAALQASLPTNSAVKMLTKADGWIQLTPLDAQPEPTHLAELKAGLVDRWPMTSLLDILKEADLRVGFTEVFKSATAWESLDRATLRKRLLLVLFALGTNAGLKRLSGSADGESYKDLLYVRRRFIQKEHLRSAIVQVTNAIFRARLPQIWGKPPRPAPRTRRSSGPGTRIC